MSINYSGLPSAAAMKNLCKNSEDQWFFLKASATLFATVTTFLAILFMLPLVLAAPIGMFYDTTFWCDDLTAVQAWFSSAMLCALTTSGLLVLAAIGVRIYTRSQFGGPAYYAELQVDLSENETRRLLQPYLRDKAIDDNYACNRSRQRQTALIKESRFSNTYLEVSIMGLDQDSTWIMFRGASQLKGTAVLMSSFFTDFGEAREGVLKLIKLVKPYASNKKRRGARFGSSKQALPVVRVVDLEPPPTLRKSSAINIRAENRIW